MIVSCGAPPSTVRIAGFEWFRQSVACSLEFRHEGKGIHGIGQKVKTGWNASAFGNHASNRCHDEAVDPVIALLVVRDLSAQGLRSAWRSPQNSNHDKSPDRQGIEFHSEESVWISGTPSSVSRARRISHPSETSLGQHVVMAVVKRITQKEGKAIAVQADVSQAEGVRRLFAETSQAFGKLDILINNAGIYEFLPLEMITAEH